MAKYWGYLGIPTTSSSLYAVDPRACEYVTPFVYGGETYDRTNTIKYVDYTVRRGNSDYITEVNLYPRNNTERVRIFKQNSYSYGYYSLYIGDSDQISYKLNVAHIKGKYKIKTTILPQYTEAMRLGNSCYPINVSINGVLYKYWCFTGGSNWTTVSSVVGYSVAVFATPNEYNVEPVDFTLLTEGYNSGNLKTEFQGAILDFGDTEQETTQNFVNYINSIADVVYSESYTVKSSDGSQTLATLTEAPPMTKAVLSTVGNQKMLTLTGDNTKEYTMTWTSETPEGYRFLGLSTKPNSSTPNVPTGGIETAVVWSGDTVLYEVYGVYRPPATTFSVYLYKCSCDSKVVDKTSKLTQVALLQGALRDVTSILSFDIIVEYGQVPTFNYAYIPSFNRYYFIDDIVSVNNNMWELLMTVDVLMTYKTAIKALPAFIDRSESNYDRFVIDNNLPMKQGEVIETTFVTNELFVKESGNGTYVLQGLDVGVGDAIT